MNKGIRNICKRFGRASALALALSLCITTTPAFAEQNIDENNAGTTTLSETQSPAEIPATPQIETPSANGFTVVKSHISAQVQTNASMHASVQNTVQLGKNCNVFFWSLASLNGNSVTNINSVRIAHINENDEIEGDWINLTNNFFDADLREPLSKLNSTNASLADDDTDPLTADNTWMFDNSEKMLYAFFKQQNNETVSEKGGANAEDTASMIIDIDYTVEDAVMAYEDVGEMYWYYLSGGNNMSIWNASAVIQLPVPRSTEVEPGETVIAWGHGAPGIVDVQSDGTIHYESPYVAQGQYMMAHVIFPVSWLENMSKETHQLHSGMRKTYAIEGEETWTDTNAANNANFFAVNAACLGLFALGIAAALALYFTRGRESSASEDELCSISEMSTEQLQQRLYTSASPAVIARLLRHNRISEADFTTSLTHLIQTGAITVSENTAATIGTEDSEKHSAIGSATGNPYSCPCENTSHEMQYSPYPVMKYPHSDVAEEILQKRHAPNPLETVRLHIGKGAKDKHLQPIERETLKILFDDIADGYPTLSISEVRDFTKAKPGRFTELMEGWQNLLNSEVADAGIFDTFGAKLRRGIDIASVLYFVAGIAAGIIFGSPIIVGGAVITAITMAIVAYKCAKRTPKGTELSLMAELLQRREGSNLANTANSDFPSAAFTKMLEDELATAYK